MPSKNQIAATLTRSQAAQAGVLDAQQAERQVAAGSKKLYGFTRKILPPDLPKEPYTYIYSVSEYGDMVNLGPGFPIYQVHACPEGEDYSEPCVIPLIHFMEEAKVDVTEHSPFTSAQVTEAIFKTGQGMNASWDRHKLGWFESQHCPPLPAEIRRAVDMYTVECKRLYQEGERFARAGQLLEINETHRRAARYLKNKVTWDQVEHKMVECAMCMDPIRVGTAVHAAPHCGAVQPGRWLDAVESGMKKLADAPPEIQAAIAAQRAKVVAVEPEEEEEEN